MLRIAPAASETELRQVLGDFISLIEPQLLELWRTTGMTFTQRRLLRHLSGGSCSAGTLAAELGLAAPSITRVLQKLEDQRLIRREVDRDDRRRVRVALTTAGVTALADRKVFAGSPMSAAVDDMSPRQQRELVRSLRALVELARNRQGAAADE